MFDIIGFSCAAFSDKVDGEIIHTLICSPRINARDLIPSGKFCFDACAVLSQGLDCGLFDPFTCNCGTAECAGIRSKVVLEVTQDVVSWVLPKDSFSEWVEPDLFIGRENLTLKFNRLQYECALNELSEIIVEMEKAHGLLNYYCGQVMNIEMLRVPVAQRMEFDRKQRSEYISRTSDKAKLYGDLFGASVLIEFPNSVKLAISAEHLIQYEALRTMQQQSTDPRRSLVDLVKRLRTNNEDLLEIAKTLTWEQTWDLCWTEDSGSVCENEMSNFSTIVASMFHEARHSFRSPL